MSVESMPLYPLDADVEHTMASALFGSRRSTCPDLMRDLADERNCREQEGASDRSREAIVSTSAAVQEAHHRVKNSLQIAASMLSLHARATPSHEVRMSLLESHRRLHLLAQVHELLYRHDNANTIPMHKLLRKIGVALRESFAESGARVRLRIKTERLTLAPDVAIPMALLANEVLTNAYKYAFPEPKCGEISLRLSRAANGTAFLCIADNGVGLGASGDHDGVGLKLIRILTAQLRGALAIQPASGTTGTVVTLSIPPQ